MDWNAYCEKAKIAEAQVHYANWLLSFGGNQ